MYVVVVVVVKFSYFDTYFLLATELLICLPPRRIPPLREAPNLVDAKLPVEP